jgi:ubiquinone/menaquinone biosynthesis C-methylase UbiE
MPKTKMTAEQMGAYYRQVHHEVIEGDARDPLSAVIGPDADPLVNRFVDYAHRLGMKGAFRTLENKLGSLNGREVLDLGCGRGRWSKEYAQRGARVTGADISLEAIRLLADEMPQHCFVAGDITELNLPDQRFDVVNSVTVIQHMPEWKQRIAVDKLSRWVKPGGYVVLLENVLAFDAPHVFPHRENDWIEMVETTGLRCVYRRGSNYEVLLRVKNRLSQVLRGDRPSGQMNFPVVPRTAGLSYRRTIKSGASSALAAASFPVEWACQKVPLATPTHSLMIFGKQL